jgi:hypothetical protein
MALNTQTKIEDVDFKELLYSVGLHAETHKQQEKLELEHPKLYAE